MRCQLHDHNVAIRATGHALSLNPSFSDANRIFAPIPVYAGQTERALAVIAGTKRLDLLHSVLGFLGNTRTAF